MVAGARAVTWPALAAAIVAASLPREETSPPVLPLRPWPVRRRRRRVTLNEPARPRVSPVESTRGELYEWHKRMGTLGIYFDLYPT